MSWVLFKSCKEVFINKRGSEKCQIDWKKMEIQWGHQAFSFVIAPFCVLPMGAVYRDILTRLYALQQWKNAHNLLNVILLKPWSKWVFVWSSINQYILAPPAGIFSIVYGSCLFHGIVSVLYAHLNHRNAPRDRPLNNANVCVGWKRGFLWKNFQNWAFASLFYIQTQKWEREGEMKEILFCLFHWKH